MHQRHLLFFAGGGGIDDVEALLFVVVERGGLFAQQIFGFAGEVEILRDESKHLER